MPQTVPSAAGYSPSFDYSTFQFDLSLLSDDYVTANAQNTLKPTQIKQEAQSPRPSSPITYSSPPYPGAGGELPLSPNYSHEGSPGYPTSPYYVPRSPQSAQFYPTSPEPSAKQPVKREKSLDLLAILQESRLLAESLGYREDSTDCTVPCTPPRTEEDIYNSLDADFFAKKEDAGVQGHPLLKEILFKEEPRSSCSSNSSSSSSSSSVSSNSSSLSSSSSTTSSSPDPIELENSSPLKNLLFKGARKDFADVARTNVLKLERIQDEVSNPLQKEEELFKDGQKSDHQLLREVLRDTSFQRKYNLRPVDLGSVGTGFVEDMEPGECVGDLTREQIEPVLSLAIQQLQKDFDNTCVALGIHPEPRRWSAADVAAWIQWARRQLQLPSVPLESFNVDGATLTSLTEEEFCQRAPQCGSMLHAQLEIWKAAVEESPRNTLAASWSPAGVVQTPNNNNNNNTTGSAAIANAAPASVKGSPCNIDFSDDEDEDCGSSQTGPGSVTNGTGGKMRNGGSHIHLWQFLKELLQSPGIHGSCIRWLDRGKGVFKIEDSVRVARLWGKRKNRPAMNYDKLSRSIRQYYKKGIMKKTERSQRLVYQFCHPYCL
ncbi:DNA-binding protein D-ETS-4 isoform X2 [Hylaeus volcanicus]|nr:DNA-binding protein D-ETS-4 isoform X2 [Hylaeus volcanicus]XP_053972665.1 DNA-binding protein D-ETS-4 isoform X2 [Hylaeus volcanicus]XP_053972666.1 DNA-binding protein D-ETS-4 isoform X2 [Hylaeus volcanicus]